MAEQQWNFALIEAAAGSINGGVSSIHGLLDEGKASLGRLSNVWGGSGSEAYISVQSKWDNSALELNNSLQSLASKVNAAVDAMRQTEQGVTGMFA